MNYVRELNAFYDWLELNPLPSHAISLWHSLMAVCNKAGWLEEFTVANGTLQVKAGVSRKQLNDSRALLVQKGRIDYKPSRRANEAGKYRIVRFGTQDGTREGTQTGTRMEHRTVHEQGPLFKQNKTKQDQVVVVDHSLAINSWFEQTFGRLPNEMQRERFCYFVDQGMDINLVLLAMKTARTNGASVNYALKILERQLDSGIFTVEQAEIDESERQVAAQGERVTVRYESRSRAGPASSGVSQTKEFTGFAGHIGRIPPREN